MENQGINLSGTNSAVAADYTKCIICQTVSPVAITSTENGRKRILEAASVRDDVITKRLKTVGDREFVYHMNNECYKKYTLKKTLDKIKQNKITSQETDELKGEVSGECGMRNVRSKSTPRAGPNPLCQQYKKQSCVICGNVKHQGIYEKYRISESNRATKFLEATTYLQDEVYTRTCDLQDETAVFGADLVCHKVCIRKYILDYERTRENSNADQPTNEKLKAWSHVATDIEKGLNQGEGYELSHIRDCMNKVMTSGSCVTNRDVKLFLVNHFGDKVVFSYPRQKNKSIMCFSRCVTPTSMAETIRTTDPISLCAKQIKQSLQEVDFDLQDRFCDANDLERSWYDMDIPEPLLRFFSVLFNFDVDAYRNTCLRGLDIIGDDNEVNQDDDVESKAQVSESRCRQIQALFQIMYYNLHCGRKRTPLHILNSQVIHNTCKSANLIKSFNRFGLCSSYDELLRLHNDIASFTVESAQESVPFPSHFDESQFTIAAFDNFDHDEATLSGIGGSHDTVTVLFQEDSGRKQSKPKVSETSVTHGPKAFHEELACQKLQEFHKPPKKADLPDHYIVPAQQLPVDTDLLNEMRQRDMTWSLARLDFGDADSKVVNIKPANQTMPSWSGTNSVWTDEDMNLKRVGFLPVLPSPVTQYETVYTAMRNLQEILQYLDQSQLAVTCDEGVYRIAREIQLHRPEEFKDIVLCMGSFHMAKVVLGCLGKYLKGSGAESILIESSVFGINVVESVLSGRNYNRSLKGMQLLQEALIRLELAEFFNQCDLDKYDDQINLLVQLRSNVNGKNVQESQKLLKDFMETSNPLINDFDDFIRGSRNSSETFRYWDTFIQIMSLLANLLRSDREGNWKLHLQTVQALLPLFAAFDSTNYLRWCSLYLEDMKQLPESAPEVHLAFEEGKFAVKRTPGHFKAVGADMALEQTINKSQKSASGILGNSRRKQFVAKWELIYHEMLAVSNLQREISGVNLTTYEITVNHEFNKSDTAAGEKNVQAILAFIEGKENPFQVPAAEEKLHNIITQEVMTEEIRDQILQVSEIGAEAYEKLRKERFVEKSTRFSATIHRTNLKTFLSIHKSSKEVKSSGKSSNKELSYHRRTVEVARARGSTMEDLLKYDVTLTSSLFDDEGMMKKAVKSSLVQALEQRIPQQQQQQMPSATENFHTTYIVDMMANVRKLKTKSCSTFGDFSDTVLDYVWKSASAANRLDIIFDSYNDRSVKDSERKRRQVTLPIELTAINRETPLPVEMDRFWASNNNKEKFQTLLHQETVKKADQTSPEMETYASYISGEQVMPCYSSFGGSNIEVPELNIDIEEADARIIPHAMHAVKARSQRIIVLSSDTDVFVLLLYYWDELHSCGLRELWVKTGVGDSTRFIPIHTLFTSVGKDLCKVLPAVHTLTGCDYTSKVGTKNAALKAEPTEYLVDFGRNLYGPNWETSIAKAEEYLAQVFQRGTKCKTMDQLRTYIYHHSKGLNLDQLPPTSYAIRSHILRACYATFQMVSILCTESHAMDPTLYGFVEVEELLMPDTAIQRIPQEYALLCQCAKCATVRCTCRSKGLPCCKFCRCHQDTVENTPSCKNPAGHI